MGMFDYVIYEGRCQSCNEPLSDFQSKDGECVMARLTPEELYREAGRSTFYTSCGSCGLWNEWEIVPPKDIEIRPAYDNIHNHPYNKNKDEL